MLASEPPGHCTAPAAALVALALISTASAKPPQTEEERTAALRMLTWRDGEALALPLSRGTLYQFLIN